MTCDHVFINVLWVSSKVNIWLQLVFISEVKEATNWNSDVYFLAGFEWVYQNVLPPLLYKFKCWPILLSAACSEIEQNMGKRVRKLPGVKLCEQESNIKEREENEKSSDRHEKTQTLSYTANPEIHCCCVTNVNFAVFMSWTVLQISPLFRLYSSSRLLTNDKCIIC